MTNHLDKIQKAFGILIGLACIVLAVSLLFGRAIPITNYAGYTIMFVFGFFLLYTGNKHLSRTKKEEQNIRWYKQPMIIIGIIVLITALLLLITNTLRYLVLKL